MTTATKTELVSYEFLGECPGTPDTLIGSKWGVGKERGTIVGLAVTTDRPILGPMAKIAFEDEGSCPKTMFPRPAPDAILNTWGDFS